MDRQLKQRVVGAAVLVILGVIFIPIFLDDGGLERALPDAANLAPPPDDDFRSRVLPLEPDDVADLEARARAPIENEIAADFSAPELEPDPVEEAVPDAAPAAPATAAEPAVAAPVVPAEQAQPAAADDAGAEPVAATPAAPPVQAPTTRAPDAVEAWTVQLGSFSQDSNAQRLIEKLRDKGYPAYLERRVENEQTVFKVRVGPQIRREEAVDVRQRLQDTFGMKGMLLRYR